MKCERGSTIYKCQKLVSKLIFRNLCAIDLFRRSPKLLLKIENKFLELFSVFFMKYWVQELSVSRIGSGKVKIALFWHFCCKLLVLSNFLFWGIDAHAVKMRRKFRHQATGWPKSKFPFSKTHNSESIHIWPQVGKAKIGLRGGSFFSALADFLPMQNELT